MKTVYAFEISISVNFCLRCGHSPDRFAEYVFGNVHDLMAIWALYIANFTFQVALAAIAFGQQQTQENLLMASV